MNRFDRVVIDDSSNHRLLLSSTLVMYVRVS